MNRESNIDQIIKNSSSEGWLKALLFALGIDALIIGLFTYWFAAADRYRVFLYEHDMGSNVPDTSPFSPVTSSRYWMSGLVAAGVVLILYVAINWTIAKVRSEYKAPEWWRVWVLASPVLLVSIPLITMTQNQPVLPFGHAAQLTVVAIVGLALALSPGRMAAHRPAYLFWLILDGFGLMLMLVTLPGLQFLSRWLENDQTIYVLMLTLGFVAGLAWLLLMSGLQIWRDHGIPAVQEVLLAGFALAYLVTPLMHHLLFTDGYYYITVSDNFLARNPLLQIAIWLIALAVSILITALRKHLARSRKTAGETRG